MFSYDECKEIAVERAKCYSLVIDKAYTIGKDYVFDVSEIDAPGIIPFVIRSDDGKCFGIWQYINKYNISMDVMIEIPF